VFKEKFLGRLNKYKVIEGDCWKWKGAKTGRGRPKINFYGKTVSVTRLILWITQDFNMDSFLHVLHKDDLCKHEDCWNPEHLYIGTNAQNMHDRSIATTHCPKEHEYTPENIMYDNKGSKVCRKCHNERRVIWQKNNKEKHNQNMREYRARQKQTGKIN
jgi:hypothetical protein